MKKTILLMVLVMASAVYLKTQAESDSAVASETKTNREVKNNGEQLFIEHADECLVVIEKAAHKKTIKGVAMIAFIPGDAAESWTSKMKVVGRTTSDAFNFLGVAYAKASEMAVTLKDSGTTDRKVLKGELGYQGGVIIKVGSGYLVGAFSGGTSQQDAEVAKEGLDWLSKKY